MDAAVLETLKSHHLGHTMDVHTRKGSPYKLGDLRKVGALLWLAADPAW